MCSLILLLCVATSQNLYPLKKKGIAIADYMKCMHMQLSEKAFVHRAQFGPLVLHLPWQPGDTGGFT